MASAYINGAAQRKSTRKHWRVVSRNGACCAKTYWRDIENKNQHRAIIVAYAAAHVANGSSLRHSIKQQ